MHGSLPYPPNAAEMAAGARFPRGKMKKEKKSSILQFKLDSGLSQLEIFLQAQNETLRITWVSLIVI